MRFFYFVLLFLHHNLYSFNTLISQGSACNNYFLYERALIFLNEAIRQDPSAEEAYQERALSYFELNQIDLALVDYTNAKNCNRLNDPWHKACLLSAHRFSTQRVSFSLDFATGLLKGTWAGGQTETIEFISCIRGSFTFLWSFACSPIEISQELIEAVRNIGEFIAYANLSDLLEVALPELIECRLYWDTWSEYVKGQKMGYMIGKYGISAFFYITMTKAVSLFNDLKRANMMAILERYSISRNLRILQESAKCASKNSLILQKALTGSVIPHNPNVLPHVLQRKHRWDRFVSLTGHREEDFKKIAIFLEKHNVFQWNRKLNFSSDAVTTYVYKSIIEGENVVAVFDVNANNVHFLINAWVEMHPPRF